MKRHNEDPGSKNLAPPKSFRPGPCPMLAVLKNGPVNIYMMQSAKNQNYGKPIREDRLKVFPIMKTDLNVRNTIYVGLHVKAAPWHKRLGSHHWGPELASPSLHIGFVMDEMGSGFFPATDFIPLFSHTQLIHFLSFHHMCGSPGELSEELWRRWINGRVGEWAVT